MFHYGQRLNEVTENQFGQNISTISENILEVVMGTLLLEKTSLSGVSADQMIVSWFIQDSNQRVHERETRTKIVVVVPH